MLFRGVLTRSYYSSDIAESKNTCIFGVMEAAVEKLHIPSCSMSCAVVLCWMPAHLDDVSSFLEIMYTLFLV